MISVLGSRANDVRPCGTEAIGNELSQALYIKVSYLRHEATT
jgi:hypothetical protein